MLKISIASALMCVGVCVAGCALEPVDGAQAELPGEKADAVSRCINYNGLPWTCVSDQQTPGDYSDDVQGKDIALKDDASLPACYREELVYPFNDNCYLSKGWHPDTGPMHKLSKVLVRDDATTINRAWKTWRQAWGPGQCLSKKILTCTL